jgi:hypothetical protein
MADKFIWYKYFVTFTKEWKIWKKEDFFEIDEKYENIDEKYKDTDEKQKKNGSKEEKLDGRKYSFSDENREKLWILTKDPNLSF